MASQLDPQQLKVLTQLYQAVSKESQMDHPLCRDCATVTIAELDNTIMDIKRSSHHYQQFAKSPQYIETPDDGIADVLEELQEQEQHLEELLAQQEQELAQIEEETQRVAEMHKELDRLHESYWETYNAYEREALLLADTKSEVVGLLNRRFSFA